MTLSEQIKRLLAKKEMMTRSEIAKKLNITSIRELSGYLRCMTEAGVLDCVNVGKAKAYSLRVVK